MTRPLLTMIALTIQTANTPTDDRVNGYFSILSLFTLPPYDNDSDLITNFIDDDYELHKILFPGSILHDSACLGNISALNDDDRMFPGPLKHNL